jgi:ribose/xylose/arabinose/galactoside ABC-type transport system permease subunit
MSTMAQSERAEGQQRIRRVAGLAQNFGVIVILVALFVVVGFLKPGFISAANLRNVAVNAAILAVTGYGMTLAIAMGSFDLSVGSIEGLVAVVVASLLLTHGIVLSIAIGLLVGFAAGILNGTIISKLHVPAFVATLGTASLLLGAALLYTQGQSILITNTSFGLLNTAQVVGIPMPFVLALLILFVLWALFQHTPFGRHVAAVGGNEAAAVEAGLKVDRITILVFGLVGLTAAISGIMVSAQLLNVTGDLGSGLALNAIAVAVLGGTSLEGGRGNLPGALVAAFLLTSISSALNILNMPSFYQYLATGLLLVGALSLDSARRRLVLAILRRSSQ